ncbi:Gfo/Idh/MocA family protein [Aestuariimicrobium ganziense]|uniref:Gfo/Idh/MocA family protein n=1 Tax=Aestuariimicrobium ganziense TaxID=2773677 RepID=UPI00194131B0|nr:Gfo/Idh/MocA family oxidoreductase [Aestuariimicrobium ganziense]
MGTKTPLRIAIVGGWHVHAGDYARDTVNHPDTEIVALWDDDPERGAELAERFGTELTDDLAGLLARDDVDGITVTTSTDQHRDVMVAAAKAGKHIFTEKVLAPTVAECEEIIAACDEAGVKLVVSLPRLYHGYTQAVKQVLESGVLGRINYSRVRLAHDGATRGWLPERFYDPATAIGGALTDLGCHPVYLTQLIHGTDEVPVRATYASVTGKAVEDHAVVTFSYPGGAIGVAEAGFVTPHCPFSIEIMGDKGVLVHGLLDQGVQVNTGDGWQPVEIPTEGPDAYAQWVDHIHSDTRADDNIARAVALTRAVVAANASAAQ